MYKLIFSIICCAMLVNASENKLSQTELDSLENELSKFGSYGQTLIKQEEIQLAQVNSCYAHATCWNRFGSYQVSCYSYGNGCSWYSQNGVGVQCTGYDNWGRWTSWWVRC